MPADRPTGGSGDGRAPAPREDTFGPGGGSMDGRVPVPIEGTFGPGGGSGAGGVPAPLERTLGPGGGSGDGGTAGPLGETFGGLAAYVRKRPPRLGDVRLVAVDGPSGAGKTRFAGRLAEALGAPVVHTDDLLDGWADQFTFWDRLENQVLRPLRRGETSYYRRYSWDRGAFDPVPVRLEPAPVVSVEGVSSSRRAIRPELSLAVFVVAPSPLRLDRVLARHGDDSLAFRAYLERWRAAEDRHFAADQTAEHADLIVDGAAETGAEQYERLFRPPPE